ncbi:MAG: hypothetical protein AAGC70_02965 [Pseudomonadota bacterium]
MFPSSFVHSTSRVSGHVSKACCGGTDAANRSRTQVSKFGRNTVGNFGGNVALETADDDVTVTGHVVYNAKRFFASAESEYVVPDLYNTEAYHSARSRLSSGFAFADGCFAMGRPVTDSFGIVDRHPPLGKAKIKVNEGRHGTTAIADAWGAALVPDLSRYRTNNMKWRAKGAPAGYDLGSVSKDVVPAYKSGIGIQVGSDASLTALGVVQSPDGKPPSLVAGTLVAADGSEVVSPKVFTNKTGRFVAQRLKPGKYRIEFASEPKSTIAFEVALTEDRFVDLGTMTAGTQ